MTFKAKKKRRVAHCRFISWPDLYVPLSPGSVIRYIKFLEQKQAQMLHKRGDTWSGVPWGPPIVVHCMAGFGRTGTLAVIYNAILRFDETKTVDFPQTVTNVRKDRRLALETREQYRFSYQTLVEYAKSFLKFPSAISWNNILN